MGMMALIVEATSHLTGVSPLDRLRLPSTSSRRQVRA